MSETHTAADGSRRCTFCDTLPAEGVEHRCNPGMVLRHGRRLERLRNVARLRERADQQSESNRRAFGGLETRESKAIVKALRDMADRFEGGDDG